jgi:hypothetical protein
MAPTPGGKLPAGKRAAEPAEEGKAQPAKKAKAPAESKGVHAPLAPTAKAVPPSDVREYRDRLVKQKKELYKDPPMLPDLDSEVLPGTKPLPTRNADGELVFADCAKFRPNLSPKEIMQAGSFGGTYFRPIVSAVTGETYRGVHKEFPDDWFEGLSEQRRIVSPTYDASVNQWKVSCGGSLGMWESSGWISFIDPYGWFQWYCRYYLGRRSTDDERQIDRWLKGQGPTGRWRTQLCNKVLQTSAKKFDDPKVSPVIRQTCLHWGYALTERDLKKHATKKGIAL